MLVKHSNYQKHVEEHKEVTHRYDQYSSSGDELCIINLSVSQKIDVWGYQIEFKVMFVVQSFTEAKILNMFAIS